MKEIYIVTDEESRLSKRVVKKLLEVSAEAGILFVGCQVTAKTPASPSIFKINVGCSEEKDEMVIAMLATQVASGLLPSDVKIEIKVVRGDVRKSN